MPRILTLAIKDLRLLQRDRVGLFFTLFFPVLFAIFFGTVFSGGRGPARRMEICIVDEDQSIASAALVTDITAGPEFTVLSSTSFQAAEHQVLEGHTVAYVRIPKGYGDKHKNVLMSMGGGSGDKATVEIGVDPARAAQRAMIEGIMQKYAFTSLGHMFNDPKQMQAQLATARAKLAFMPGMSPTMRTDLGKVFGSLNEMMGHQAEPEAANGEPKAGNGMANFSPIQFEFHDVIPPDVGPPNSYAVSFPQAIIWGVISCALGFGVSLVVEQRSGTLARLRMSPLRGWHVLLGKALACFITVCLVCTALFIMAWLAFGVHITKPLYLACAIASVGVSFVGAMMLCACAGKTEAAASGIGWSIMMVFAMVGGAAVPNMFMPAWLDPISNFSPVKWAIYVMEAGIWRPLSPVQMATHCGVLIALGVGAFSIGAVIFQRRAT